MTTAFVSEKDVCVEQVDSQYLALSLKNQNWVMDIDSAVEILFQLSQAVSRMEGAPAIEIPSCKH